MIGYLEDYGLLVYGLIESLAFSFRLISLLPLDFLLMMINLGV